MCKNPTISKDWIKEKYWHEQLTDIEMSKERKVPLSYIQKLIREYGLQKKKNGIKGKGKLNYKMPEHEKEKHRFQPHAKEIVVYKGSSTKAIATFRSINHAAIELNLCRNHIKDCLNPNKNRWSSKGYRFEFKKYKGEILVERKEKLDYTLPFEEIGESLNGLHSGLPKWNYEDRINHYNRKLQLVWEGKLCLK